MSIAQILNRERFLNPSPVTKVLYAVGLLLLAVAIALFVYYTGGTRTSALHLLYIPIILAGFLFSIPAAIFMGMFCGILIGPWMPVNVATGEAQSLLVWVMRMSAFVFVGSFSGYSSYIFRRFIAEQYARHSMDPVTNLPNYHGLEVIFNEKIKENPVVNILLIDIRNMKELETAIGQINLTKLLEKITRSIKSLIYSDITLGYSSTLGFVLLVPGNHEVANVVERYQKHLELTHIIDDIPIYTEIFYGVANYPEDGADFKGILKKAQIAIEHSEKRFVQLGYYDPKFSDNTACNLALLHDLDFAIKNDKLSLAYQPKVDLLSGNVLSVEALARWHSPERGDVAPIDFIALTERTLLINPFTKWLITRSLNDLKNWHEGGIMIKLAINFSMKNFHDPSVFDWLVSKTKEFGLDPAFIEIEVTESAVSADMDEVSKVMRAMQSLGFTISIDDFGTGQASQQYLFELPINSIKIDQMFTRSLPGSKQGTAIIKSAITLGNQLGLEVIAEGVENPDQHAKLVELGCLIGQGYGIARPMPPEDFKTWLGEKHVGLKPINTNSVQAAASTDPQASNIQN